MSRIQAAYVPSPQFSLYILLEGRCLQTSECRITAVETKGRQEMCMKTFDVTFILPGSLGLQAPTTFKSLLRSLIAHLSNVTKTVSTDTD